MPVTGLYYFLRYRAASRLTVTIEHPLTGKKLPMPVSHLLPYKGRAPEPVPPRVEKIKACKRVRLHALQVAKLRVETGQWIVER